MRDDGIAIDKVAKVIAAPARWDSYLCDWRCSGCMDPPDKTFTRVNLDLARNPTPQSIEVFLGDYVDRVFASRQVLERLVEQHC